MSHYLSMLEGPERAKECAKNDAQMGGFSEAELIAADLAYLERREQRFRDRLTVVHEMELDAFRRAGWL